VCLAEDGPVSWSRLIFYRKTLTQGSRHRYSKPRCDTFIGEWAHYAL
jgi:hypothetical protein